MTFKSWIPAFLALPIGGLIAIETVGSLDGPVTAAAGGLIAGAFLGGAQWLALRSRGIGLRWAGYTAAAVAAGTAAGAVVNGAGTDRADLVIAGLITGAAVGVTQSLLLGQSGRVAAAFTAVTAAAWPLGWLATSFVIVDIERGYYIPGASGALIIVAVGALALRRVVGVRPAAIGA